MLLAAGIVTVGVVAGKVPAQSADINGVVEFEGGAPIPKGEIEIHVEDPTTQDDVRQGASTTRVRSDGASRTIDFTLSSSTSSAASLGAQIVVRLERADGWLLARGSAQLQIGSPVYITLHTVMY